MLERILCIKMFVTNKCKTNAYAIDLNIIMVEGDLCLINVNTNKNGMFTKLTKHIK